MNDFEKSMFIFFDEWGGVPKFQAEHGELYFYGVDIDELTTLADYALMNDLFDLGWLIDENIDAFVSTRWGSC